MNTSPLEFKILRMKRKTIALHLLKDGTLEVRAPYRVPERTLAEFVGQKEDWVKKARARQRQSVLLTVSSPDDFLRVKENTRRKAEDFLACYPGEKPLKIQVRRQKSVWGTCSRKGAISLNALCSLLPDPLFEYVMIHELCHLVELNHSTQFWAQVSAFLPDWKHRRAALRQFRIGAPVDSSRKEGES